MTGKDKLKTVILPVIALLIMIGVLLVHFDIPKRAVNKIRALSNKEVTVYEEKVDIAIDGFFLAIGHKPNTDIFKEWLETDEVGYLKKIDGTPRTKLPGIFVAGDCADPVYRQAISAAGTGCQAAIEAERFLLEN